MISVIKNIRMFVVHSILRGGKARQISAGIFYALADHIYVYGFVPPCRVLMDLLPLRWNATGKAEPFFYFIFFQTKNPKLYFFLFFITPQPPCLLFFLIK